MYQPENEPGHSMIERREINQYTKEVCTLRIFNFFN